MEEFGIEPGSNLVLLEPLPYLETLSLASKSRFVITDSGGLQKEAYWLGKPSLITRDTTEWGEVVKAGAAFLVGSSPTKIATGYKRVGRVGKKPFLRSKRIFGEGHASAKVVRVVSGFLASGGHDNN